MARILVDLADDDIRWLDNLATESGKSRAAVVREAVAAFRATRTDWLERGFGLWTLEHCGRDGGEFEEHVRARWPTLPRGEGAA